ncbi:hypothetical protein JEQ12_006693 [Ovis aries]|uniref:Uncharacterized protein n=1 Tax=Ovis aries TaxID=9940 RepID=A0A836CWJ6_SHEEP|nr:hypothetical protein JEQ12_006693 [Ovis aries]
MKARIKCPLQTSLVDWWHLALGRTGVLQILTSQTIAEHKRGLQVNQGRPFRVLVFQNKLTLQFPVTSQFWHRASSTFTAARGALVGAGIPAWGKPPAVHRNSLSLSLIARRFWFSDNFSIKSESPRSDFLAAKLVTGPLGKIAYPNRSSYEDTDYSKDNQTYSCRAIRHGALFSQFSASEDRRRESTEQFPVWVQSRKVSDNFTMKRTEGLYIWSQERKEVLKFYPEIVQILILILLLLLSNFRTARIYCSVVCCAFILVYAVLPGIPSYSTGKKRKKTAMQTSS